MLETLATAVDRLGQDDSARSAPALERGRCCIIMQVRALPRAAGSYLGDPCIQIASVQENGHHMARRRLSLPLSRHGRRFLTRSVMPRAVRIPSHGDQLQAECLDALEYFVQGCLVEGSG
jgi:hypothetical protein